VEVYLRNEGKGGSIRPQAVTVDASGGGARLVFNYDQLDTGTYTIHTVNPGGLQTTMGPFRIAFKKSLDINAALGYQPMVPLYGQINDLLGINFFPQGSYGRLSFVPLKQRWGYLGMEIEPFWTRLYKAQDYYEVLAQVAGGALYGLYQWHFPNRVMALSVRAGGGIYSVLNYHLVYRGGETKPIQVLIPMIAAGVSFQWFIRKPLFVEAGADYLHLFSIERPMPGYIRPFVGAGWQF
jgi:hypothetical protein